MCCFHLCIFLAFSNVFFFFSFFESITNPWTKIVATFLGHPVHNVRRNVLGRGIGLEIRSRFESRSKIESVIALHRWMMERGRWRACSKRHVFERIPGLLRTLYLYARILCAVIPASLYRIRKLWAEIRRVCGTWQVGEGRKLKGSVINRVMGVCGSAVHHGQSCFRLNSFNRSRFLFTFLFITFEFTVFYISKFIYRLWSLSKIEINSILENLPSHIS